MTEENEQKKDEGSEETPAVEKSEDGGQSETAKDIDRINDETNRLNKAIAENENAKARAKLGGVTLGGGDNEPKEQTNKEFVDEIFGRKSNG